MLRELPTIAELAKYADNFLDNGGGTLVDDDRLPAWLDVSVQFVRSYTRDQGFKIDENYVLVEEDVAAVIISYTARAFFNPKGVTNAAAGPFQESYHVQRNFTLVELAVLNRYRRRAA